MASRDEFDDFFGDDDEPPIADTRADGRLYRVPLGRLAPNLVNPRTDFGTGDQLIDFGKSLARRQNQPCPVVSRVAYLKLWPDHASKIGDADYVLVSGERRYRAATAVGLPGLDCVANDDFARDRRTFMEAVVSENVDRQNFDPVEEAYAVQALATEFGSNRAVAQHFERADGWVTQRILLTHLAREVQALVRSKEIPLDAARSLGKQARDNAWDAGQQLAWWEAEQERRTAASAARSAVRKAARQAPTEAPTPVIPAVAAPPHIPASASRAEQNGGRPDGPEQDGSTPESFTAVKPEPDAAPPPAAPEPAVPPTVEVIPEQRDEAAVSETVAGTTGLKKFSYDDAESAAYFIINRMPDAVFDKLLELMNEHYLKRSNARS
jgi:ParB family chromosome partitioning protein